MIRSDSIGLNVNAVNESRIRSLVKSLEARAKYVCNDVTNIYDLDSNIFRKQIPLFRTGCGPAEKFNLHFYGIKELEANLVHLKQDEGVYHLKLRIQGHNIPGFDKIGSPLTALTTDVPIIQYSSNLVTGTSFSTDKVKVFLAIGGKSLYYHELNRNLYHQCVPAIFDRLFQHVNSDGESPILCTFVDQNGALQTCEHVNCTQLPLIELSAEDRLEAIMTKRPALVEKRRNDNSNRGSREGSDALQNGFNNSRRQVMSSMNRSSSARHEHDASRVRREQISRHPEEDEEEDEEDRASVPENVNPGPRPPDDPGPGGNGPAWRGQFGPQPGAGPPGGGHRGEGNDGQNDQGNHRGGGGVGIEVSQRQNRNNDQNSNNRDDQSNNNGTNQRNDVQERQQSVASNRRSDRFDNAESGRDEIAVHENEVGQRNIVPNVVEKRVINSTRNTNNVSENLRELSVSPIVPIVPTYRDSNAQLEGQTTGPRPASIDRVCQMPDTRACAETGRVPANETPARNSLPAANRPPSGQDIPAVRGTASREQHRPGGSPDNWRRRDPNSREYRGGDGAGGREWGGDFGRNFTYSGDFPGRGRGSRGRGASRGSGRAGSGSTSTRGTWGVPVHPGRRSSARGPNQDKERTLDERNKRSYEEDEPERFRHHLQPGEREGGGTLESNDAEQRGNPEQPERNGRGDATNSRDIQQSNKSSQPGRVSSGSQQASRAVDSGDNKTLPASHEQRHPGSAGGNQASSGHLSRSQLEGNEKSSGGNGVSRGSYRGEQVSGSKDESHSNSSPNRGNQDPRRSSEARRKADNSEQEILASRTSSNSRGRNNETNASKNECAPNEDQEGLVTSAGVVHSGSERGRFGGRFGTGNGGGLPRDGGELDSRPPTVPPEYLANPFDQRNPEQIRRMSSANVNKPESDEDISQYDNNEERPALFENISSEESRVRGEKEKNPTQNPTLEEMDEADDHLYQPQQEEDVDPDDMTLAQETALGKNYNPNAQPLPTSNRVQYSSSPKSTPDPSSSEYERLVDYLASSDSSLRATLHRELKHSGVKKEAQKWSKIVLNLHRKLDTLHFDLMAQTVGPEEGMLGMNKLENEMLNIRESVAGATSILKKNTSLALLKQIEILEKSIFLYKKVINTQKERMRQQERERELQQQEARIAEEQHQLKMKENDENHKRFVEERDKRAAITRLEIKARKEVAKPKPLGLAEEISAMANGSVNLMDFTLNDTQSSGDASREVHHEAAGKDLEQGQKDEIEIQVPADAANISWSQTTTGKLTSELGNLPALQERTGRTPGNVFWTPGVNNDDKFRSKEKENLETETTVQNMREQDAQVNLSNSCVSDSTNNNDSLFRTLDYSLPSTHLLVNHFPSPDRPSIGQELSSELAKGLNASQQNAISSPTANLTPQNSPTMRHAANVSLSSPVPSPLPDSLRSPTATSAAQPDIRLESPGASFTAPVAAASASSEAAAASSAVDMPAAESGETGPKSATETDSSAVQEAVATSKCLFFLSPF